MQLKGLPFVVFDQGGVMEMIDNKGTAGNVILEPTADALYSKLSSEPLLANYVLASSPAH